jgi:hypothetical protein
MIHIDCEQKLSNANFSQDLAISGLFLDNHLPAFIFPHKKT